MYYAATSQHKDLPLFAMWAMSSHLLLYY